MPTVTLACKSYERRDIDAVGEAFWKNFLFRRLVVTYEIPLADITPDQVQHVTHDLNSIRYRAWLALRHHGLTLADIGQLVNDENAIDVFVSLWQTAPIVFEGGTGPEVLACINERRAEKGLPSIRETPEANETLSEKPPEQTADDE